MLCSYVTYVCNVNYATYAKRTRAIVHVFPKTEHEPEWIHGLAHIIVRRNP